MMIPKGMLVRLRDPKIRDLKKEINLKNLLKMIKRKDYPFMRTCGNL